LDEPTNHLDIHSVELLIEALNKYEGSIVLVSHDRYFISQIANKIWEIEDHKIREFKGTYKEWEDWKARREAEQRKTGNKQEVITPQADDGLKAAANKIQNKNNRKQETGNAIDKELQKELQKQKKLFQQLEEKIASLTKKKARLETDLALPDVYSNKARFLETEASYKINTEELQKANTEYEIVFEKLMKLEEKTG
jgi:ATP-binding cassette subfamily F protein 3